MADADVDVVVQSLDRVLLDGVDEGTGEGRRRVDLAVLPCFADERPLQGLAGLVDWRMGGRLSTLVREGFCEGTSGEAVLLPGRRTLPMDRLVILGLGPSEAFDRSAAEAMGERLVALVRRLGTRDVLVAMPGRVPDRVLVEAVFDGLVRALRSTPAEDAAARPTVMAVGDDGEGPLTADGPRSELTRATDPAVGDAPAGSDVPRPTLAAAPSAMPGVVALEVATAPEPSSPPVDAAGSGAPVRGPEPAADSEARSGRAPLDAVEHRWWIVADPRHHARLRRLLDGPPRAAEAES